MFPGSGKASCVITCLLSSKERRWPAPHPLPQTPVKLIVPWVLNSDGLHFSFCLHSKVSSLTESWPGLLPFPFPAPRLEQFCFRETRMLLLQVSRLFSGAKNERKEQIPKGAFPFPEVTQGVPLLDSAYLSLARTGSHHCSQWKCPEWGRQEEFTTRSLPF